MTLSLILRDPKSGEFASIIASSSPAVAARCLNLADGVGAAHSQNVTDPRLGVRLLDALRVTGDAQQALDEVVSQSDSDSLQFRQLLVMDAHGRSAGYDGKRALGIFGSVAKENAIAGGNMLANDQILEVFVSTALSASGPIERRAVAALQAAVAAGGEAGPLHSAGLAVVGDAGWRVTDLRVDWSENPVADLAELVEVWLPQRDDYVTRGHNPNDAPSYGVPGDE